jgi:hypothetical protein
VVVPFLVRPPHNRIIEPNTSATARLRAAGSWMSDRATRTRVAAGDVPGATVGDAGVGVSSDPAAGALAAARPDGETGPQAASAIARPSAATNRPSWRRLGAQIPIRRRPDRLELRVIRGRYSRDRSHARRSPFRRQFIRDSVLGPNVMRTAG